MNVEVSQNTVSRETLDGLQQYADLLKTWTPRINLISKGSIEHIWNRHILDSLQIARFLAADVRQWADFGSGGGLPGIVLSIVAREIAPEMKMTLVESDSRKSVFLRTAIRELDLNAEVITKRVENIAPLRADIVSARALTSLSQLLSYASRHLAPHGEAIFPKGESWKNECDVAAQEWSFDFEAIKSETDSKAVLLRIGNISHV